jgi:segregation and condensation protein B
MESESRTSTNAKRILEALLFASDRPLRIRDLRPFLPEHGPKEVGDEIVALRDEYDREERSFHLVEIEGGWQLLTRKEYFPLVRKLRSDIRPMRLSRAAVETLAIIAYRQPATRSEIEQIRGVDAGGVLKTLLERDLITLRGRAEGVGRPLLYGTTDFFLNHFGLKGLDELPRVEELTEIMKAKEMAEIEAEVNDVLGPRAPAAGSPVEEDEGSEEAAPESETDAGGDGEPSDVIAAGDL